MSRERDMDNGHREKRPEKILADLKGRQTGEDLNRKLEYLHDLFLIAEGYEGIDPRIFEWAHSRLDEAAELLAIGLAPWTRTPLEVSA
jgi:hypothetical protein